MRNANMSFTIIILSLQDKLLCEFCIIFTSHYFTYRMSCLHRGISKTSSVHFTQLPVSNMKFPYGITSYWTLMIYLEWTFKVYLCVAGFSYVRTCIRSPCKFGTSSVYAVCILKKRNFPPKSHWGGMSSSKPTHGEIDQYCFTRKKLVVQKWLTL